MAKKRKKEKKEEGYEFKMPEFDEEEYLRREVRDAKALFVTFGYAVLIGLMSFGLTAANQVALAVLVGLIAVVFLRHIYPRVGIDTTSIEKKTWAGNIIMFLFTWLAIWILLSNPPFSDIAAPTIDKVEIYFEENSGNWTKLNDTNRDELIQGMNVSINAVIVDNVKVDEDTITLTIQKETNGGDYIEINSGRMERVDKNEYSYFFSDTMQGRYKYTITAVDVNDHEETFSETFNVG